MDYQIKLTKKSNQVLDRLKDKIGFATKSEALNFVMIMAYKYSKDRSLMFKPSYKVYEGEVKYHFRGYKFIATVMKELQGEETNSEFINLMVDVFNHGWNKGKGK